MSSHSNAFEKNLQTLRASSPEAAFFLQQHWVANGDKGLPLLATPSNDYTVLLNGKYIHSRYAPRDEASRIIDTALKDNGGEPSFVLLGFGLGYCALALFEKLSKRNAQIIVIEKRLEVFTSALYASDLTSILAQPNIKFLLGLDAETIQARIASIIKAVIIKNRALCDIDTEYYRHIEKHFEVFAEKERMNNATLLKFGALWKRNYSKNKARFENSKGINALCGSLKGKTALVIAAGPTLDKSAAQIKALSKNSIVISTDTSLRYLYRHQILPTFAVSADAQYYNYLHSASLPASFTKRVSLVTESTVYPAVFSKQWLSTYFFNSTIPLIRALEYDYEPRGTLSAGGSVSTTALDFAYFLGAKRVIIAGLDLSYPNFNTHYKGAYFEQRSHSTSNKFSNEETRNIETLRGAGCFYAQSASGGKVLTDRRLSLYASWFEAFLRLSTAAHTFRLSSEGIFIAGMELWRG